MSVEPYRADRIRRINEIRSLINEPAVEAWNKIETGVSEEAIANELGYPVTFFYKLISDEFLNRLSSGSSFFDFPQLTTTLEDHCWRIVCRSDDLIFSEKIDSPISFQLRMKLLELHKSRTPIKKISRTYEISQKRIQSLIMLALAEEGLTLDEIGNQFSVTRERVRQLIAALGISIRSLRHQQNSVREQNQVEKIKAINNWIGTHPGCFLSEVSTALNVLESDIQKLCPQTCRKLVLGGSPKKSSENYSKYSRDQILEAIRNAYELRNPSMTMYSAHETQPVSGTYYEKLRQSDSIYGPSQARIIQIFGTWKNACQEAGVPSLDSYRKNYDLRWSDEELVLQLAEFISSNFSPSVEGFDEWSRCKEGRCSSGTIRNQLGAWSDSYQLGLIYLRQEWTKEDFGI